ncbi:hypothetical protein O181_093919 [Austropuccinia psidii MF-1]|uniref:Uncharacterized protein n=1 Tax=Austropuccinia psidii MF-1 TaxID=1389203 RepID=A0A9Q3J257_9BASI|nr:hypothetical protein [Austropuccinia psidii MF-1]
MWVIIHLPERFKTTMEVCPRKCAVKKKYPSLNDTWEAMRKFLKHNKNGIDQTNQAPATLNNKRKDNNSSQNETKIRKDGDYPKCAPGWQNSLIKPDESGFNYLKLDKSKTPSHSNL